jgi:predicted amidophosphoribosyltransferase
MVCKGICTRHKAPGRYTRGQKRCGHCNLFIKWDGVWCPCCGYKLRSRPRRFSKVEATRRIPLIDED